MDDMIPEDDVSLIVTLVLVEANPDVTLVNESIAITIEDNDGKFTQIIALECKL